LLILPSLNWLMLSLASVCFCSKIYKRFAKLACCFLLWNYKLSKYSWIIFWFAWTNEHTG
jgi:hypothetical protein